MEPFGVTLIVLICCFVGAVVAIYHGVKTFQIPIGPEALLEESHGHSHSSDRVPLNPKGDGINGGGDEKHAEDHHIDYDKIKQISGYIADGAQAFLTAEYAYLAVFVAVFSVILLIVLGTIGNGWASAGFATLSFILGAVTSIVSGYIGMRIAVGANSRTAIQASNGFSHAFGTAFKAGMVMGFGLVALGILVLFILIHILAAYYDDFLTNEENCKIMFDSIAGYGLGGSTIALFGRVGGGIYTKAADVGADLSAKVLGDRNWPEDDPRNPAVIADNVGDNVGDIAGMGADLFGSLAEGCCAAMVVASQSEPFVNKKGEVTVGLSGDFVGLMFPLLIMSLGILVSLASSFVATHIKLVNNKDEIEPSLKRQIMVSTVLMTPVAFLACWFFLPATFNIGTHTTGLLVKNWYIFICVACGLWSGLAIGYITEYFTSYSYQPVRDCVEASKHGGAATNIIYGLALGYKSAIIPVFCLCITIYLSHTLAGMFGIACGAIGILSTLPIGLTIDAYGPICDNAGGVAEMCHMPPDTRDRTDCLDAAGNTTAAIGKGFAIGSAALVSLSLFGAFVTAKKITQVNILDAFPFAGLLLGAMIPYWFSAMTMKSVGKAASDMVKEVERQLNPQVGDSKEDIEYKRKINAGEGGAVPDYQKCVAISTRASLREMIAPGLLVILTPIIVGFLFGVQCLAGTLAGILVSGVQLAISASNTGGAWDNCKKYIGNELGNKLELNTDAQGNPIKDSPKMYPCYDKDGNPVMDETGKKQKMEHKKSELYKAAVIGDTVGDPLKDTSGPSINILIKLTAIISVVFAPAMPSEADGGYIEVLINKIKGN